jgi:hypothetical protein
MIFVVLDEWMFFIFVLFSMDEKMTLLHGHSARHTIVESHAMHFSYDF